MPIGDVGKYTDASRHFVELPNGNVVTRATAENMYARASGFKSNYELKQAMKHARANGFRSSQELKQAMNSNGYTEFKTRKGYDKGLRQAKASGTSETEYKVTAARYYSNPDNKGDNSPDGPKAKMLEAMGRRSPGNDYNVGESPGLE